MHKVVIKVKKLWWLMPILIIGGSVVAALYLLRPEPPPPAIAVCEGANTREFKCWEQRYQQMVVQQSPKAAFADARGAYETNDYVRTDCHQIAHVIGRAAAERYGDVIAAYNEGDNFCWSGYYHGVMETVVKQIGFENITTKINEICQTAKQQQEFSFYHYNCVHGLGHGLMAIQNNDLFASLKSCNGLEGVWQQDSCYGGVFMENVMSEVNPDHKTQYFRTDDPLYPCTAVDKTYKTQCYMMQTSHALRTVGQDYAQVFTLCGGVEAPYTNVCYQSLGRDVSGNSVSNAAFTKQNCMLGPTQPAKENCFTGAVKDFISYFHNDQQGLALCQSLEDENLKSTCVTTAQEYYKTF